MFYWDRESRLWLIHCVVIACCKRLTSVNSHVDLVCFLFFDLLKNMLNNFNPKGMECLMLYTAPTYASTADSYFS